MSSLTALITGATGYVGSQLARRLVAEGWKIHVITRPSSDFEILKPVLSQVEMHEHDGSTAGMIRIMDSARPEIVFHLASLALGGHKPEQVEGLINSNVLFATQLVEAMVGCGVHNLINTGTSWQHYDNENYNPVCLYAATKQAFEDILRFYIETSPVRAITLKLFDNYGPDDPRNKIINLLRQAAQSATVLDMSPGQQLFDIVYIDDVVDAYCTAAKRVSSAQAAKYEEFAVTSGSPVTLQALVHIYEGVLGKKIPINWGGRPYRPREVMVPWSGGSQLPGWSPRVGLEEGLRRLGHA